LYDSEDESDSEDEQKPIVDAKSNQALIITLEFEINIILNWSLSFIRMLIFFIHTTLYTINSSSSQTINRAVAQVPNSTASFSTC
jgi:hypothetical protein